MKEKYIKPVVVYEDFSLTQTIATDCGDTHTSTLGESNHYTIETCQWDANGVLVFFTEVDGSACDDGPWDYTDFYEINGYCYNNPDGGAEIFSSC